MPAFESSGIFNGKQLRYEASPLLPLDLNRSLTSDRFQKPILWHVDAHSAYMIAVHCSAVRCCSACSLFSCSLLFRPRALARISHSDSHMRQACCRAGSGPAKNAKRSRRRAGMAECRGGPRLQGLRSHASGRARAQCPVTPGFVPRGSLPWSLLFLAHGPNTHALGYLIQV